MTYMNAAFWKKAYLLEFKINGKLEDAFTFSVPPQSEEFSFLYRKNETKTFGGIVVDDYGNDSVRISLSGNTINQEVKYIYGAGKKPQYLTGEEEIFYLQKLLHNYGELNKLKGKEIYLYSLDRNSSSSVPINKCWRVFPGELKIKRSKDMPLTYAYSIEFTGIPYDKPHYPTENTSFSSIDSFNKKISDACAFLLKGTDFLERGLAYTQLAQDWIAAIRNNVNKLHGVVKTYTNILSSYTTSTAHIITEMVGLADDVVAKSQRVVLHGGLSLYNGALEVSKSVKGMVAYVRDFDEKDITQDLIEQYQATTDEIKDTWNYMASGMENEASEIVTQTKKQTATVDYSAIPGDNGKDDTIIITYGFIKRKVKSTDTWDSLAKQFYNNPAIGSLIALYNGMDNNSSLKVGDEIVIPIISRTDSDSSNNMIFSTPDQKDNYGKDFGLSGKGIFLSHQGDFAPSKGVSTVSQGINNRLQTELDTRIRLVVYGIRSCIGNEAAASAFLISSIQQTILSDPRVKSIEKIAYTGKGENIHILVNYTDINSDSQTFGGTL